MECSSLGGLFINSYYTMGRGGKVSTSMLKLQRKTGWSDLWIYRKSEPAAGLQAAVPQSVLGRTLNMRDAVHLSPSHVRLTQGAVQGQFKSSSAGTAALLGLGFALPASPRQEQRTHLAQNSASNAGGEPVPRQHPWKAGKHLFSLLLCFIYLLPLLLF